jgi:hypothetical protein
MAPGANTYGTVADIQRLIGDIVASRTFGAGTTPSTTQVEAELDNVAAEINAALDVAGYTVPINATDYPTAYAAAKAANNYGASARLLSTLPSEAYDPDEQIVETGEARPQQYEKLLNRFIKRIEAFKIRAGRRVGRLSRVSAGAARDEDGYAKNPLFTRQMDRHPDRQTDLTEEDTDA